jgi:hypothetical protein
MKKFIAAGALALIGPVPAPPVFARLAEPRDALDSKQFASKPGEAPPRLAR